MITNALHLHFCNSNLSTLSNFRFMNVPPKSETQLMLPFILVMPVIKETANWIDFWLELSGVKDLVQ